MAGHGHYAMRRDFGLNTPRMALPEVQDSTGTSNQTMPGFTFEERARKRAGIISMQGEASEKGGKPKSSWTKKMRGLFRGRKKKTSDSGGNVVLSSAHHNVPDVGDSSPSLHVRAVRSSAWAKQTSLVENGDKEEEDQRVLPYRQQQSEPAHWREEEKASISRGPPELIRLTLKPKGAMNEVETRQVTLWRKAGGFGVHLSAGLPPIAVTYVEPGGDAEAAGVCIGDVVLEVNGQNCREGVAGISVVMGLKMLIQQVKVSSKDADESSESLDEEPVDDAAWQRIKAKQDDMDSQASNVEVTCIDDELETGSQEDLMNELQTKVSAPKSGPTKETHISDKEWVRMREQQELLFDKNAPSAIIQEKGKEKPKHNKQNEIVHSETMPAIASSREGGGLLKTPDQQPGKSTSKTSPSRFGKKSGPKVKSPSTGDIAGEMTSPEAVLTSPSKGKESRSGKRKKHSKSKKKSLSTESKNTVPKEAGDSMESYDGGASPQKMDDKIRGVHNMGLDQVHGSLGPPSFTSSHRSPSYHTMELGKEKPFRDELRQTSKSEYDIASNTTIKMEIDANVRVSKSGKVIGPSSRGSSRRPSIFDQSAASSDGEWDDSHVSRTSTSPRSIEVSPAAPTSLDLSAIPKMSPSLGLQHGHNRRDLAARSASKRRPASMKKTLLLNTEEGERMGTQRVSLSEERSNTLPTQRVEPVKVTVAKSRSLEHGDATMPAPTSNKERKRQEEKPQNLILQACLNSSPRVGQKGYDTPSGSSADKVSQALRKQRSSESETESPEFLRRRRTLSAVSRGSSILAEIRSQKEREKEREIEKGEKEEEGKERSAARKLFTDAATLKSELEEVKLSEKESPRALVSNSGAGRSTSASNHTGRIKSVDKPIKTLEIASEPEASAGSTPPPSTAPRTERPHRAKSVEKPIKTLGIASEQRQGISTESKPPAWVAIAQGKHRRVSAAYTGRESSTQPLTEKDRRVSAVYTGRESQMTSTQPLTEKIQELPATPSTSSSNQPPSPFLSPTPNTTKPPSPSLSPTPSTTKPSKVESSLPKRGTVKDRMALFQKPK